MINHSHAKRPITILAATVLSSFLLALVGCNNGGGAPTSGTVRLQGAGATFPNPIYQKWFSEYNKINPGAVFDYQSIGSGGGIKQITERTIDFGGSDAPMKDEALKAAPGAILHIPTVLGAVVVTYNLPEVQTELKLTPQAIAGIYLGQVKKWNDAAIAATNAGVKLPAKDITVVHRSDGSGTTYVWTDFLAKVSPDWKEKVGTNTSVNWPVGVGAKGNEGVTGQVKQTPYSIGYVELIYAQQNNLPFASVQNSAGEFVKPSFDSVTAAAAGAAGTIPDDLRVSITNPPGKDVYPISSFTYMLVYTAQTDEAKGRELVNFLWWAIHDGQSMAKGLGYAPLPNEVVAKAEGKIKSITYQGKPLKG
ncbi:MAG: phosphate ABC transporter substrate-binding protein PstS [Blastocatellia bacterium]|nr:phosphate ABC transporter substrate-binding protein PstS [Blastocatellia bacterium]